MSTRLIRSLKKVLRMKLTPKEQLDLALAYGQSQATAISQAANLSLQNQAHNNQYSHLGGVGGYQQTAAGIGTTQNLPFTVTSIGGGGAGMSSGGGMAQQGFQNTFISQYPLSQPSLDFQVDMIFAAVEKHLRKLIREEMARAARSLPESETEE